MAKLGNGSVGLRRAYSVGRKMVPVSGVSIPGVFFIPKSDTVKMFRKEIPAIVRRGESLEAGCFFLIATSEESYSISLKLDTTIYDASSRIDFFYALCILREVMAKDHAVPLCNGADVNVWPSGMQRQMGMGLKAYYIASKGEKPTAVDVFAQNIDIVPGTPLEQRTLRASIFGPIIGGRGTG